MRRNHDYFTFLLAGLIITLLSGCATMKPTYLDVPLTEVDLAVCSKLEIETEALREMKGKPLFEFSEQEIDAYLGYLQETEPDLRTRVQHLARKATPVYSPSS